MSRKPKAEKSIETRLEEKLLTREPQPLADIELPSEVVNKDRVSPDEELASASEAKTRPTPPPVPIVEEKEESVFYFRSKFGNDEQYVLSLTSSSAYLTQSCSL